jgi:DNA-binding SARP family transcriptional activator
MEAGGVAQLPVDVTSLYLLGRWRLVLHGAETEIPGATQRLVALLALRGSSSRSRVAQLLWPDRPAAEARALLRNSLWRTGQSGSDGLSGNGLLRVDPHELSLRSGVTVDTWALERTAHQLTDGSGHDLLPALVAAELVEAGDLLDGWYDNWVLEERERLSALRLRALEVLAGRCFAHGRFSEALAAAEAATRLDPLRDGPAMIAMRVHLAEGNPVLAVRCFDDLKARLWRELQVEPDPRCRELVLPYLPASS